MSNLTPITRSDNKRVLLDLNRVVFAEVVTSLPDRQGRPCMLPHPTLMLVIEGFPTFQVHRSDERRVWKLLTDEPYPIPTNGRQIKMAEP